MNKEIITTAHQILPKNQHYLNLNLYHLSSNKFDNPDMRFINNSFEKNNHHVKSAMGLWTCNNRFVSSELDLFYQYKATMKPETKWTIFSYSNFVKLFDTFSNYAHQNNLSNEELNKIIFQFYEEIRKKYDVFILFSKLDKNEENKYDTNSIEKFLQYTTEEIIILNFDMISEWKMTGQPVHNNSKKNKL